MNKEWPTKEKDMHIAQVIMQEFSKDNEEDSLGLFELVVNQSKKRMGFRLSTWVVTLARHFKQLYGAQQGDFVTRKVISQCIRNEHTVH